MAVLLAAAGAYFLVLVLLHGLASGSPIHRWARASTAGSRADAAFMAQTIALAVVVSAAISTLPVALLAAVAVTSMMSQTSRLRRVADHDPKTGLLNHRGFQPLAASAVALDHGANHPTGVLMLDLDRFKDWNARLGHAGADELLLHVVAAIRATIRRDDLVCRWGGEELVVVCPNTSRAEAVNLAERIRGAIEHMDVVITRPSGGTVGRVGHDLPRCTVSIGIAMSPDCGADIETLQDAADKALETAKLGGRNRSVLASFG